MLAECTRFCTQPTLHSSHHLPIALSMPPNDSRTPSQHPITYPTIPNTLPTTPFDLQTTPDDSRMPSHPIRTSTERRLSAQNRSVGRHHEFAKYWFSATYKRCMSAECRRFCTQPTVVYALRGSGSRHIPPVGRGLCRLSAFFTGVGRHHLFITH